MDDQGSNVGSVLPDGMISFVYHMLYDEKTQDEFQRDINKVLQDFGITEEAYPKQRQAILTASQRGFPEDSDAILIAHYVGREFVRKYAGAYTSLW